MARRRRPAKNERGIALLIAIISIAILTVVAADFAYNTRVDLQMAANQRDEVRAYYLAKSGIGLSRMLLRFQKQIDAMPLNLGALAGGGGPLAGLLGGLTGGAAGANPLAALGGAGAAGALGGAGMPSLNIQLWQLAKVDCHMLSGLVKQDVEGGKGPPSSRAATSRRKLDYDEDNPEVAAKHAKMSFGGFDGCFEAQISPEEPKLNVNKLDSPQLTSGPVVRRMIDMFSDKRFEFLFEHEDANKVKVTPQELVINLHDWMDEDEGTSALNLTLTGEPFLKGFQDEAYFYDRYTPRYRPKNARFDTLDELYMVHGMNDRLMAAFKDRFTVYPDVNTPANINTDDPMLLYMAILSVMDPMHPDPRLVNPLFVDELIKRVRSAKLFSFFGMSTLDFVNIIESAGITVNSTIRNNVANNRLISDKNSTFTISSTGQAGSVERKITAVVRMDDSGLGRLLYWKEH